MGSCGKLLRAAIGGQDENESFSIIGRGAGLDLDLHHRGGRAPFSFFDGLARWTLPY
jgi:hypothetical protein